MIRETFAKDQIKSLGTIRPKLTVGEIARRARCSLSYAKLVLKGKLDNKSGGQSRQDAIPLAGRVARMPAIDNEAIANDRSLYHKTVVDPAVYPFPVLKSGYQSSKIGKLITKGKWKGFPIYTLTLEERATCPRSCHHYRSCFGNGMPQAHRLAHGDALEVRLVEEVTLLALEHPKGFAVRLHVLGDFNSVEYVKLWEMLLQRVPQLHVFGFSARWDCERDPIAAALVRLVLSKWERFAIRFSNAPVDECSTVSIEHPYQKPDDAVICPQQISNSRKNISCGSCGFCWNSKRRLALITH